jgi:hypothetical protein
MKKPLSWIFLLIPGLILAFSCVVSSVPGTLLSFYLVGIAFCIPSIGFSVGWIRWTGIGLALIFIGLSFPEQKRGLDYARFMGKRLEELKQKNQKAEPSGSPNPLQPAASGDK